MRIMSTGGGRGARLRLGLALERPLGISSDCSECLEYRLRGEKGAIDDSRGAGRIKDTVASVMANIVTGVQVGQSCGEVDESAMSRAAFWGAESSLVLIVP
jgi:hypothetical protein